MKYILYLMVVLCALSCGSDNDICTSGEATPRMKLKFLTAERKQKTLDTLYLSVDYASGKSLILKSAKVDSVFIPLRVDGQPFTDFYIRQRSAGPESKIRVKYTTSSEYVSPACGIKRFYENMETELLQPDPVTALEKVQNSIVNEDKTHLYLIF